MIYVVGAGPAGSYFAGLIAEKGYAVTVFEDHDSIGDPCQCTGIVTSSIQDFLPLDPSIIMNHISKVKVVAPSGTSQEFSINDTILDRPGFDRYVAKVAEKKGVRILKSHRFAGIEGKHIIVENNGKKKRYRFNDGDSLVGADGPNSSVAKAAGIFGERKFYFSSQATAKLDIPKDTYEVYLGNEYCPEFFAWVVPESEGVVRIGLGTLGTKTSEYFQKFLKFRLGVEYRSKILGYQGGPIPYYDTKLEVQKENVYLIGDAAFQVKATTGGGIIQGMIAGKCLAEAISEKKNYKKLLKKRLDKDLWIALQIRRTMNRFSDKDYDKLIELFNQKRIKKIIETHDRDYPSRFMFSVFLKEPRFLLFGRKLLSWKSLFGMLNIGKVFSH